MEGALYRKRGLACPAGFSVNTKPMFRAATLAFGQLFDSRFLRVLGQSAALTLLLFVVLAVGGGWGVSLGLRKIAVAGIPTWFQGAWSWLDGVGAVVSGLGLFGTLLLLFPAVATIVMGAFLDTVVDAVEDRHYRQTKAPRPMGLRQGAWLGLLSGGRMLLLNLLLLPVYTLLFFMSGIGPLLLYLLVNGYLLGRDMIQMVAIRHLGRAGEKTHRGKTRNAQFAVGVLTSLLYLVPIANLLAPLLGAAMATHVFHQNHHV
jgi:CysZ protein